MLLHSFSFIPTEKAWSTNQDRNLAPHARAKLIKAWKAETRYHYVSYMNRLRRPHNLRPGSVQVTIPLARKPTGDPHNYCGTVLKAVIDGLVLGGAWPDDGPEYVGHTEPILIKGKVCVVEIYER